MAINLFDIGAPLNADGFSQDEMMAVLQALEQEKVIAFGPGNRISFIRKLAPVTVRQIAPRSILELDGLKPSLSRAGRPQEGRRGLTWRHSLMN